MNRGMRSACKVPSKLLRYQEQKERREVSGDNRAIFKKETCQGAD